jgi:hypothetical protein
MKKLVLASVMALTSISLVITPTLRAQGADQGTIQIQNPAEFNAYQNASTQTDPKAKASALEDFLTAYPQSVVKKSVLEDLTLTYQQIGDTDKALSAASRLLQVDPNDMRGILISVVDKRAQCIKTSDPQTCDDGSAIAQKGLAVAKAADMSADDWKKMTDTAYPLFHSVIALDDLVSKKDSKTAEGEYTKELMLYPLQATTGGTGLVDTLYLAEAYAKPDARDMVEAIWFYARAWNFAPPAYKAQIEPKLEYWYKRYHGNLDDLDAVKTASASSLFKPDSFTITPAPTPDKLAHDALASGDPMKLNLEDKEFILANGNKEDSDKLWALLKDQPTPVPGIVIEATASVLKIAVTQDAKDSKVADFIVNLKKPLDDKDIPAAGSEFKLMSDGGPELDGTYDTFTPVPATATTAATAQIVLRDGFVQAQKKAAPVHHPAAKPSAGHHTTAH